MRLKTVRIAIFLACLALAVVDQSWASGLSWPANRYLPSFSTPASMIDCIDISSATGAQQDLFASLEGIVNRIQPRIACISSSFSEGEYTWLGVHNIVYNVVNGYSEVLKFEGSVTGLVVTDPSIPDTLNLATTIAGVKNELICNPSLLPTLTNAPYYLSIKDDLRGKFSDKYGVYQYLYTNYWPLCTHRVIAGMETNADANLRDYLVALQVATVWLDPGVPADAALLGQFVSQMTPVGGVYMGWWPSEDNGLSWIGQYGIPVIASDYFWNGSLYSGVAISIAVPPIPTPPPLKNKVYYSITLSDGDNVQYMQHWMKQNWGDPNRGKVPMGWTTQPIAADLDPGMLNYYWNSATTNDCLVAGPSGAGYNRINYWSPANITAYTEASAPYLQRAGITTATIWSYLSTYTADAFAANCPAMLGIYDFGDGSYATSNETMATIGFPGDGNYVSTTAGLITAITNAAAGWIGSAPMFVAVEGVGWDITPTDCQTIVNSLNTNEYIAVRPDQLFMFYRQWAGLVNSGAPKIVGDLPATLSVPAGFPLSQVIYPLGTQPMSYQWKLNGQVLTNGGVNTGAQGATLNVTPAFAGTTGQYQVVVSNVSGIATSKVCSVAVGRDSFAAPAGWSRSGSAGVLANNSVKLTDGNGSEASSVFMNSPQFVGAFTASYTYQDAGGGGADGCAFVLQNSSAGPLALGAPGGVLGYGGLSPSVALEFNIYSPNGVGMALRTDGITGSPYNATGSVNLAGGHPITTSISYNGAQLSITMTDTVSHATFATNVVINIVGTLGTNTAFVGFTAADGGIASTQVITNFQFASLVPLTSAMVAPNTAQISWPNAAGGLVLQQASVLGAAWTTFTNPIILSGTGSNQATISAPAHASFYQLATP
jgi:hypothetical protein